MRQIVTDLHTTGENHEIEILNQLQMWKKNKDISPVSSFCLV